MTEFELLQHQVAELEHSLKTEREAHALTAAALHDLAKLSESTIGAEDDPPLMKSLAVSSKRLENIGFRNGECWIKKRFGREC